MQEVLHGYSVPLFLPLQTFISLKPCSTLRFSVVLFTVCPKGDSAMVYVVICVLSMKNHIPDVGKMVCFSPVFYRFFYPTRFAIE